MAIDFLNVPEERLDRPVEPWTPTLGQWVRVRPQECPDRTHQHRFPDEGALGVVAAIYDHGHHDLAHRFLVRFEPELTDPNPVAFPRHLVAMNYAAVELEPLAEGGC